jgi:biotin operon repressor
MFAWLGNFPVLEMDQNALQRHSGSSIAAALVLFRLNIWNASELYL